MEGDERLEEREKVAERERSEESEGNYVRGARLESKERRGGMGRAQLKRRECEEHRESNWSQLSKKSEQDTVISSFNSTSFTYLSDKYTHIHESILQFSE